MQDDRGFVVVALVEVVVAGWGSGQLQYRAQPLPPDNAALGGPAPDGVEDDTGRVLLGGVERPRGAVALPGTGPAGEETPGVDQEARKTLTDVLTVYAAWLAEADQRASAGLAARMPVRPAASSTPAEHALTRLATPREHLAAVVWRDRIVHGEFAAGAVLPGIKQHRHRLMEGLLDQRYETGEGTASGNIASGQV
jgi:hypothetical protein